MIPAMLISGFVAAAALGAAVRYLSGLILNNDFPLGTLSVNLLASFLLGLLMGADVGDHMGLVVGTGALGALSTWSAAANEAAVMARRNEGYLALAYIGLTVLSGVTFAWFGIRLGAVM
jgi:CrcB protein